MLMPRWFGESLFDDWMEEPFRDLNNTQRRLYGKHADALMRTDVREKDDCYEVDIDLPGFKKEEISLELQDGTLTVSAAKALDQEHKDDQGRVLRQERYAGSMQRSFYLGENVTEEDVKARFEDGVLRLTVPKKDQPKLPEKKVIMIEG